MPNQSSDLDSLLLKYQQLFNAGYLKESLAQLIESEYKMTQDSTTLDTKIRFYILFGNVALKLSILRIAMRCVKTNNKILYDYDRSSAKFYTYLYENGLISQKIEYWLCKYSDSTQINHHLVEILNKYLPLAVKEKCEVLSQLGNTYRAWCKYELAQQSIDQAFNIFQDNPQKLDQLVVSNLFFVKARYCMDTDSSMLGIELAQKCIKLREQYYKNTNPTHIDIYLAYELIGKLHFSVGQIVQAESYHNQAYEKKLAIFGKLNFESVDTINERGRIMLSKKQDNEAKEFFQLLGTVSLVLLGPVNQYEALSYNNLGCVYYNQKKYEESIENHTQALRLYERLCGKNHYKLVFAMNQMAYSHKNMGRYKAAIDLWQRCIMILKITVGPPTEKNIKTMNEQINLSLQSIED